MPRRESGGAGPGETESKVTAELGAGFEEELREFLEADNVEVDADPLFRERLRRRLWAMLMRQLRGDDGSQGSAD